MIILFNNDALVASFLIQCIKYTHWCCTSHAFNRLSWTKCVWCDQSELAHYISIIVTQALHLVQGCLHGTSWHFCTFLSSIQVPFGALYLFKTYQHVMLAQIQPSCYFAAVQNLIYVVLCKQGATSHFGTKSAPRWTGMGSACIILFIHLSCCCHYGHKWSSSHPTKKPLSVQLFLCKHCLM